MQRTVHGNGSDRILTEMLADLEDQSSLEALDLESVKDRRQPLGIELDLQAAGSAMVLLIRLEANARRRRHR
jgi:hypothetical protein